MFRHHFSSSKYRESSYQEETVKSGAIRITPKNLLFHLYRIVDMASQAIRQRKGAGVGLPK
jgi:hypothetical protein